jgi:hypothetical protein
MLKQKPFPFSVLILIILIGLHLLGSYFSWYWSYPRFEIIIHVLAGVWAGSVFLWLASYLNQINSLKEYKVKSLLIAMISAALIGVVWELLENFGHLASVDATSYKFNTAMDILNDVIGGIVAYLYFIKRTRKIDNTIENLHPFYNKIGVINETNEPKS